MNGPEKLRISSVYPVTADETLSGAGLEPTGVHNGFD